MIKFDHFTFKYNAQVEPTLRDINLTINDGEKVLIAGPSGCGKSTLIHCINGLIPFSYEGESSGSLTINGKETKDMSIFEISKEVGTVLQDQDAQFIGLTVAEDIAFSLENDCIKEPELHDRVSEIAKTVSIDEFLGHGPNEVSGGQKQRVSLAGVLVDNVNVLLFDEPLANLDPKTGKTAIELIDEIHEKTGVTVIIVEHRLEDVLHMDVDRVILMDNGKIVMDTTPDKLLSSNALIEAGVREPLYITALKYAGVEITENIRPRSINTIKLSDDDIDKVNVWFNKKLLDKKEDNRNIILSIKDADFTYRSERNRLAIKHAIDHVSLDVKRGEMMAIVGKNGAGKSTLSKLICGFMKLDSGDIQFEGKSLKDNSIKEIADHIGYIMQNPNQMISKVMIFDEVALGLRTRNVPEEEIEKRVNDALKVCGIWQFRKWPISALSYGQKKRVTIASILVLQPDIIILDEPTAGQDFKHYTEIMQFLKELNNQGITVILITHDMHLMLEYAERSVVFADSHVVSDDTAANILTNREIIDKASLKETSLYELALKCNINDATSFVQHFIDYEEGMH